MKINLVSFLAVTFLVLFMPHLGKAQLGGFALGALSDIGSSIINEGVGSFFNYVFDPAGKQWEDILNQLQDVLNELNNIEIHDQQITQQMNFISIAVEKRIVQEELRNAIAAIDALDNDLTVLLRQTKNGLDSVTVTNLATRLRDKIDENIEVAVERIHASVSDFMVDLLTELVTDSTDIINTNLNINYALNTFGGAYRKAIYLLTGAQQSYSYLEGAVNNTKLYLGQLKDWQDVYLKSPVTTLVSSLLNGTTYTAPSFNGFRTYDFYNCINYTTSSTLGLQFRYWYPDDPAGNGCQNHGIVMISRGSDFTLQSPTFSVQIRNVTNNATFTMATSSSTPPAIVAATTSTPIFNQTWNIVHPSLDYTYIPLNQTLAYIIFQQSGKVLSRYELSGSAYKMYLVPMNVTPTAWQALSVAPSPNLTSATIDKNQYYKTIHFYPNISLGFSATVTQNGPLYLDWYTDPAVAFDQSLQNQWLQVMVPNKTTFLWINRYYNYALTMFNNQTLGLAPLYANHSNNYSGTVAGNYVNQEWSLSYSNDTLWADPWNRSTYAFRQQANNQDLYVSVPLSYDGNIDFDFRSFPLTLGVAPLKKKAREQIFYINSTEFAFQPFQSGLTYRIGTWLNASNSLSAFDYLNGSSYVRSFAPADYIKYSDIEWTFTPNGNLYFIQNGESNCLTIDPSLNATIQPCVDPSTQLFSVQAEPALAGLAYNITNGNLTLATYSTLGNGDYWYFYYSNISAGQPSDPLLARVRLDYVNITTN